MGGRGRGRGNAVSFNIEQLGFGRGEAGPVSVTQPPPLFPSLENRPLPLIKDVENEYILVTQKDLSTRMRNSPFYLKHSEKINSTSYEKELPVLWNRMPAELRDDTFTKRLATGKSKVTLNAKRKKVEDPDKIFAKLEKKERNESEGDGDGDGKEDEDDQDKSDDEKVEMEDDVVEDEDEEMDKDTDYANNYFENGEGYLDDEEGQDDGEAQF
ncbi:DNA-directed RNA polymerase III subunit RPC7-like isoform X1 [Daphnia pulicaria]|uniref:DNA-directed RNA polymerase III subunit RPC7-like isoform X1 n=1 Tax=Daphnia pulicaria TaxID=35523 RepID=UPI001EECA7A2|nr:DNA-directed RNA polymerase III subunit RPC7-like isoform X1 [Daphnia pulicaria]